MAGCRSESPGSKLAAAISLAAPARAPGSMIEFSDLLLAEHAVARESGVSLAPVVRKSEKVLTVADDRWLLAGRKRYIIANDREFGERYNGDPKQEQAVGGSTEFGLRRERLAQLRCG